VYEWINSLGNSILNATDWFYSWMDLGLSSSSLPSSTGLRLTGFLRPILCDKNSGTVHQVSIEQVQLDNACGIKQLGGGGFDDNPSESPMGELEQEARII